MEVSKTELDKEISRLKEARALLAGTAPASRRVSSKKKSTAKPREADNDC